MHHVNIAESWRIMFEYLGFSLADLREMLEASIESAWVSDEEKARWRELWLPEFDALAAKLPALD